MSFPILSSLILLPSIGALFLFFTKSSKEKNLAAKYVALFTSLVNFFLSVYLWILFDQSTSEFQFVEDRIWIEGLINYKVGIDGISILFIILTTFITPLCIISVNNSIKKRLSEFLIAVLIMESFMIGAEFLGMIMLIVYVGAVAVLFLFVVMMLNVAQQKNQWFISEENSGHIPVGLIISAIIFFELIIVIGGWKYKPDLFNTNNSSIINQVSNTHSLGQVLYTDYIHVFQISGMNLLIAMIGAIVLTFRKREGVKKQSYLKQISRERSEGVEVLEVSSNKGVKIDD
jgi:NADH-quinone oxidoreductase subunit J